MLHYIKGKITMKFDGGVVVENNGMGYEVHVADNSAAYLVGKDETILLYIAMIVREDDVSLYGFMEQESLELFHRFLTVSGVGAKGALALLSCMPLPALKQAIAFEDAVSLTKANGIGKKTAQRIIIDLKDKLGTIDTSTELQIKSMGSGGSRTEALNALISLGYSKSEAAGALSAIREEDISTEEYIKRALKCLF